MSMTVSLLPFSDIKNAKLSVSPQQLGCQSWTENNLCVESYHDEIMYYMSRPV